MALVLFFTLLGAAVGSFLNVCIYRMPREGLSVSRPRRSFCPSCGTAIAWHDNIPIVSWIRLGGRCRACRAPISPRYVLVEALTAALFGFIAWRFLASTGPAWGAFAAVALLTSACLVASFIDIELRIIPDQITVRGMMLAPFLVLLAPELHVRRLDTLFARALSALSQALLGVAPPLPGFLTQGAGLGAAAVLAASAGYPLGHFGYLLYWRKLHPDSPRPQRDGMLSGTITAAAAGMGMVCFLRPDLLLHQRVYAFWAALAGMLTGSLLVFLTGVVGSKVFRKPAMGFGDVKLMGLLGAFTGWLGVLATFFIACFLGSVVGIVNLIRSRSRYIAFGPFLAAGALCMVLYPEGFHRLLKWYLGLFG